MRRERDFLSIVLNCEMLVPVYIQSYMHMYCDVRVRVCVCVACGIALY